jgi:hypothetical protein
VILGLAALVLPVGAQDVPVTFRAVAVNLSNVGRQTSTTLEITIERWSTPAETERLSSMLLETGSDKLLDELQDIKPRAGFIRATGGGLGWDIQFAQKTDLPDGGKKVVFATDRPMSFVEAANRPRSADYEFLLGELRVRGDGEGQGKLVPRAKITYNRDTRTVEIENYASEPVRLTRVTEEKKKDN